MRILAVEERLDANGNLELEVTAEEWPFGIASAVAHATASSDAGGATARTMDAEATALEAAADNWSASATLPSVGATYNALAADPVEQRIVAVGSSTVAALSLDGGLSWASKTITPAGSYYAVVHTGTFFSAIGTAVSKSTDGSTWSAGTMPGGSPTYRGLAYGNGTLVAVGTNLCAISTDGLSWTPKTIPAGAYTAVAYVPGVGFAAVGDGCAAYSADGVTWYAAAAAPTYASSIACDGARLVTAGNSNHVNISDDGGNHWYYTVAPAPGRYQSLKALYGLTYAGSGVWAMVGAGGGLNQCSTARALHFDNNHGSPIAAGTFIFHPGIPFGGTAIARAGRRYVVIGGDKFSVSSPA